MSGPRTSPQFSPIKAATMAAVWVWIGCCAVLVALATFFAWDDVGVPRYFNIYTVEALALMGRGAGLLAMVFVAGGAVIFFPLANVFQGQPSAWKVWRMILAGALIGVLVAAVLAIQMGEFGGFLELMCICPPIGALISLPAAISIIRYYRRTHPTEGPRSGSNS
jgi:hypothetical protein